MLSQLTQTSEQLTRLLGREPTCEEIGKRMRIPPSKVESLRTLPTAAFSVDAPAEGHQSDFEIDTLDDVTSSDRNPVSPDAARCRRAGGTDGARRPWGRHRAALLRSRGPEPESLEHIEQQLRVRLRDGAPAPIAPSEAGASAEARPAHRIRRLFTPGGRGAGDHVRAALPGLLQRSHRNDPPTQIITRATAYASTSSIWKLAWTSMAFPGAPAGLPGPRTAVRSVRRGHGSAACGARRS